MYINKLLKNCKPSALIAIDKYYLITHKFIHSFYKALLSSFYMLAFVDLFGCKQ